MVGTHLLYQVVLCILWVVHVLCNQRHCGFVTLYLIGSTESDNYPCSLYSFSSHAGASVEEYTDHLVLNNKLQSLNVHVQCVYSFLVPLY